MKRPLISVDDEVEPRGTETPRSWQRLANRCPQVVTAYDTLSDVSRSAGPLDESVVALVKLAVSVGPYDQHRTRRVRTTCSTPLVSRRVRHKRSA